MRILLTADPLIPVPPGGYGGIERIIDALGRGFTLAGHDVGLLAHPDSTCPVAQIFSWPRIHPKNVGAHALNSLHLWKTVRSFRPDIIHSFSRLLYLAPLLPARVPKIMSYQRHTGPRQSALAGRFSRRGSLGFTACSEFIRSMALSPGTQWDVVPNFVECDLVPYADSVGADAPLLFLSRIEAIKGPDLAIAIAKRAGRRLILAGNIPDDESGRDFWEKKIRPEIGRNRIEYVGEVNDAQKYDLLRQSAALLVPIQWHEPFGIVFVEALAAGTPVITSARGALPEILRDGVTGFFIEGEDSGVRAIERLPTLSRQECRRDVEERFDAGICCAQYLDIYRKMLSRGDK